MDFNFQHWKNIWNIYWKTIQRIAIINKFLNKPKWYMYIKKDYSEPKILISSELLWLNKIQSFSLTSVWIVYVILTNLILTPVLFQNMLKVKTKGQQHQIIASFSRKQNMSSRCLVTSCSMGSLSKPVLTFHVLCP